MAVVRYPLSGRKGMVEVSLYKDYADISFRNLEAKRYFETIIACSIGLDVLLNTLPDRMLTLSSEQLDSAQVVTLKKIEDGQLTSGSIIQKLKQASILAANERSLSSSGRRPISPD
jgi:hypothetical protein